MTEKRDAYRRWRKRLVRGFLLLLLLALALLAVVLFTPFSSSILDRRIQRAWRESTGLEIAFDRAVYYMAWGRLEMRGIEIQPPGGDVPPTEIDSMRLFWRWRPLNPSVPMRPEAIEILEPGPMTARLTDGRLHPGPRLRSITNLLRRMAASVEHAPGAETAPMQVRITDFGAVLLRSADDAEGEDEPLGAIRSLNMTFAYAPEEGWRMNLEGRLAGRNTSPAFKAAVSLPSQSAVLSGSIDVEAFDSRDQTGLLAPHVVRSGPFHLEATLTPEDGAALSELPAAPMRLRMNVDAQGFQFGALDAEGVQALADVPTSPLLVVVSDTPTTIPLETPAPRWFLADAASPKVSLTGRIHLAQRTLSLNSIEAELFDSRLAGAVQAAWQDGATTWSATIDDGAMSADLLDALAAAAPWKDLRIQEGGIEPRLHLGGDESGPRWESASGTLTGSELRLATPWSEKPVGPVQFEARLTTENLELVRFDAQSGPQRLTANGRIARRTNEEDALPVRGSWTADLTVEPLHEVLKEGGLSVLAATDLRGVLLGSGSLRGTLPSDFLAALRATPADAPLLQRIEPFLDGLIVHGLMSLDGGYVDHTAMPAPLTDLVGELTLTNRAIDCNALEGRMLGSRLTLGGQIRGEPFFWREPVASITLAGDLNLDYAPEMLDMLTAERRASVARLGPTGRLTLDLRLRGPLASPAEMSMLGDLGAENIALNLETLFGGGRLKIRSADVHFTPERVTLAALDASLRSIDIVTSGVLSAAESELNLRTHGQLDEYAAFAPHIFADPNWRLSGPVRADLRLTARMKPGMAERAAEEGWSRNTGALLAALLKGENNDNSLTRNRLAEFYRTGADGVLDVGPGVRFTHPFMPNDVTDVDARFSLDETSLSTIGWAETAWGASLGQTSGTLRFEPGQPLAAEFTARFPDLLVDEWIQRWGPRQADPSQAPPPLEHPPPMEFDQAASEQDVKAFVADGTVVAEAATWKGLSFTNLESHFIFQSNRTEPDMLVFDRMRAAMYDGEIEFFTVLLIAGRYLDWRLDVNLREVDVERMLEALYQSPATMSGTLSTRGVQFSGLSDVWDALDGSGRFTLSDSRFMRNPIFLALGRLLNSDALEDVSFTTMEGRFDVDGKVIQIPSLELRGPLMDLSAHGQAGLNGDLDLAVIYRFIRGLDRIPLLGTISEGLNYLGSRFFKIHVGGTLQSPDMTPLVLSQDEISRTPFQDVEPEADERSGAAPSLQDLP